MKKIKSKLKGWAGELGIRIAAAIALPSSRYHKFHNIILPTDRGTTQIDHILVSKHGVFVVETKFMKGWIYGGQYDKEWTQKFPRSSYKFQNPLRQNYAHTKALEAILPDTPPDTIHSVIAMCGEHKIKTPMPANVARGAWYIRYVRRFRDVVFSDEQVATIIRTIESLRLPPTKEAEKEHVESLRRQHQHNKRSGISAPETAIHCSGELVTTSKLASLLKISTDETLIQLVEVGFLMEHGEKHRITEAGQERGGKWQPNKFWGYFLWPISLVDILPGPNKPI